ncbi:MAG: serine/threonine protein kinase [Deltaproteobacteria bacterium]|nr:serine/threonine protein kinase [Deltaproteobacteria bacterium]
MDRPPPESPNASVVVGRPQMTVEPGRTISDKYRVEKEIGRGGYGIVVRALHLALDQKVAIKILTPGDGSEKEWAEDSARFRREAQATATLKSEHIVRILDVDRLETPHVAGGCPYMVMEYLEGDTLHNVFHTRGPLSVTESVDTMVQVLAALGEAHAAGIVHRDLKPANIYLTRGHGGAPVAKVLDFGVSKMAAATFSGSSGGGPITKTGAVIGTVAYMAPEQMLDAKRVDARADLWSAGLILYEILTKELPFGKENAPTLVTSILTKPPIPLTAIRPDIPPRLEAVIMRALQKPADARYPTAAAMAAALAEFASPQARTALDAVRSYGPPRGAAAPAEKGRPRLPSAPEKKKMSPAMWVAFAGAAATVALLGMSIGVLLATPEPPRPRSPASASASPSASASASVGGTSAVPSAGR